MSYSSSSLILTQSSKEPPPPPYEQIEQDKLDIKKINGSFLKNIVDTENKKLLESFESLMNEVFIHAINENKISIRFKILVNTKLTFGKNIMSAILSNNDMEFPNNGDRHIYVLFFVKNDIIQRRLEENFNKLWFNEIIKNKKCDLYITNQTHQKYYLDFINMSCNNTINLSYHFMSKFPELEKLYENKCSKLVNEKFVNDIFDNLEKKARNLGSEYRHKYEYSEFIYEYILCHKIFNDIHLTIENGYLSFSW
jgi:hypothetical protein